MAEQPRQILIYRSLDDVPLPPLPSGEHLDPGIVPLLRALRSHRLATRESCEGHEAVDKKPYPWVELMDYEQLSRLDAPLAAYNQNGNIPWVMVDGVLRPRDGTLHGRERRTLQDSAAHLAAYLFECRPELYR